MALSSPFASASGHQNDMELALPGASLEGLQRVAQVVRHRRASSI
jgi:hypothetical protein